MLRAGGRVLTAAIAIATATAIPVVTQVTPGGGQPQPEGTARLIGRVVAADDGRPVRRAYLILSGRPTSQQNAGRNLVSVSVSRHLETSADGRFEFTGLPAGSYDILVLPPSAFAMLSQPKEVRLIDGESLDTTIRLTRTGAIVGRVLDESSEAVVGAQVHAVRRSGLGGHVTLSNWGRAATADERGQYRLYGLTLGEYILVATYNPVQRSDGAPAQRSGFARTYYPGSSSSTGARSVAVRAGQDTEGVDFTLTARRLARVTVTAANAAGVPLARREAQLTLWDRDEVFISAATYSVSVNSPADGTFIFRDIPPGDYRLLVKSRQEAAYLDVTVAGEDVSLNVRTNLGATVSGRVLIDGQPAGTAANATIPTVVGARQPPRLGGYSYAEPRGTNLRDTDRFELTGLRGPTVLTAQRGRSLVVSMRRAGEDIIGTTLDLLGTETIDDIVIEFTTKSAEAEVTIIGTSPLEEPEPVRVVLFAEDPALWRLGHVRYTTAYAPRDSKAGEPQAITLSVMPAGRYLAAAFRDPEALDLTAPPVLEALRKQATPVTLVVGQTAKVALRVTSLPR